MARIKNRKLIILAMCCVMAILIVWSGYRWTKRISNQPPATTVEAEEISILWARWTPADLLQTLSQDFTQETGVKVNIVQDSWSTWQQKFFDEMARKGEAFDMVIGDSQWLGKGATEGYYVELTQWIQRYGVDQSMTTAAISGYSEFPKGSGHYWAVPVEGDAMGFSYRKDLFSDPMEKEAFKSQFGYDLDVPQTWQQLKDIASFFYRPEKDLYGVLAWVEPNYDGLTMGVQSLIWAWGAELGNHRDYRVHGILNSPKGVEALEFYKALNQYNNPEWRLYYLDTKLNSNLPMMEGRVAMAMGYFAINTELLDHARNPFADQMGFFANPRGPKARVCSLGGQGISIVSYGKKKDICFRFLEWFIQDHIQEKWAELGGLTCNIKVLASEKFLNASPINRPFKESIEMARDFWAVPEYPALLAVSQKYWNQFISENQLTAKESMDNIAREWEQIFEDAGYYKE